VTPLRVIFAGSGEFGLPTLARLINSDQYAVVQVITQPDRPSGRGLKLTPTAVARLTTERNLSLLCTPNINDEKLPDADVMVVIAFGQKVAPPVVNHPRLGSINLHASLLPKYRGAAPINWAIISGERVTGNSVIRLAPKMDAGAVLGQSSIEMGETETAGEVHARLAEDGARLVPRVLDDLARGTATEIAQDESQATLAPKLSREHAAIDWTKTADAIAHQIRGMHPWPGCRVRLIDGDRELARLTLVRARPIASIGARPGEVLPAGEIGAGDGAVEVIELQPEGKRPMPLRDFRNGHAWHAGMRLESVTS
jgi:methionyl-tRNA formyltransferase